LILQESLEAAAAAQDGPLFVRPRYEGYSYAQIPATIPGLFGAEAGGLPIDLGGRYDAVILLLVDAFGWRFFTRHAEHPFLRRFVGDGQVALLSSQFPSTTAAHVTTIHTGLTPGQSGVHEWFYYEPQLDAIIAPLLFSYAGDVQRERLHGRADPATLFPSSTLYHQLAGLGVASVAFQHISYASSSYTRRVTSGATVVPYRTLPEALVNLATSVAQAGAPIYAFLYIDTIDTIAHRYGPDSPQLDAEIGGVLDTLERTLQPALARSPKRTLLLVTADHGQTAIDPATTRYLNQSLPALEPLLRTNRKGVPLVPAGSARDLFLYLRPEALDEAHALLVEHLAGIADVRRVPELIAQGFFGGDSPALRERVGDLVVLPYAGESVWWYERGRFEQIFYGSHGGLLRDEMETILLALPYV
jgi:hypothetical protein